MRYLPRNWAFHFLIFALFRELIPEWIFKMAESERSYEDAKRRAGVELERCRSHIRKEFEQRRKRSEESYKAEMEAMRKKLDKRLNDLEQAQTDLAVTKFRRLSMDQSIRSRQEREKKMREMNKSSKEVFDKERKRFSVGAEQLMEQKMQEHRELMHKLAVQEAKALERLEEIVASIHADGQPTRSTSR
ncbi:unnamed protein product [Nippostrongylus brasiliensis]|uniref:Uncharacterized protein n=2 Tax=Nippostrongylus brasiliensis TaxID=27835 RepID=A0A0N4YT84_NIPBR|nr:unnamed protein product [Nippostrongylus brasiliensis]